MNGKPILANEDYEALAEFRYQIRRFLHFSEDAARVAGVEPQHHQLMLAVKGFPQAHGPRVGDVAERLQLQPHSAVELVNRSAQKGLIRRTRGEDRREVHLRLTPRGERILRELTLYHREELRSAAPALVAVLQKLANRGHSEQEEKSRSAPARRRPRKLKETKRKSKNAKLANTARTN